MKPVSNQSPVIAPPGKIQSSFLITSANNNGLKASSSGIGLSSSIYNLPGLSQEGSAIQTTARGLKPFDNSSGKVSASNLPHGITVSQMEEEIVGIKRKNTMTNVLNKNPNYY